MSSFPLFIILLSTREPLVLGVFGREAFIFSFACVLPFWSKDSEHLQSRRNRDGFSWVLTTGTWNRPLKSLGCFLSEAGCIRKAQQAYTGRKEEILYLRNKKLICPSPQFVYKPLKTLQPTPHLSDTQTLIKQGQNQSRNKLRQGLPFLGLLPKRRVY